MGDVVKYNRILIGKPKGRAHLEDLGLDGLIIFELIKIGC
jgi:hypothetical protein